MAVSLKIEDIQRRGNRLYVRFGGGHEMEGSRRDLREHCQFVLDDNLLMELAKAFVIARGLRASASDDDADDLDSLIGKTITINVRALSNICRIT